MRKKSRPRYLQLKNPLMTKPTAIREQDHREPTAPYIIDCEGNNLVSHFLGCLLARLDLPLSHSLIKQCIKVDRG